MPWQRGIAGGNGTLLVNALKSSNYAAGTSGFSLGKNGDAEFNDITIRGGTVEDGDGLYYSPSPGAGNLVASVNATGPDAYGNATIPGLAVYNTSSFIASSMWNGSITWYSSASAAGPWTALLSILATGETSGGSPVWSIARFSGGISIGGKVTYIPPSGDTSGGTDASNIANALAGNQVVMLMPGQYWINQTIQLPPNSAMLGAGAQATTITVVSGSALKAAIASAGWTTSANTVAQSPVNLAAFTLNANSAANYGIVSQNFWSYFTDLTIYNANIQGLRFDSWGANGTTEISGSAVENHITRCQFRNNTGSGFRTADDVNQNHYTDGWLTDCVFEGPGATGTEALLQIDSSAGWRVEGNHLYGAPMAGISMGRLYNSRIVNNYIETWGTTATAGYWAGIDCGSLSPYIADDGNGSVISGNTLVLATAPAAGSFIDGISLAASGGSNGNVTVTGNSIGNTLTAAAAYRGALVLQAQNSTATLNAVTGGNLTGPGWNATVFLQANGGTINHTAGV